jgi:glutamyl-Q tRNA(Asp) synthetase
LLRIEDIDPPREQPGAADRIIETLRRHGFQWSGDIFYQGRNLDHFEKIVRFLLEKDLAFPCRCSRRQVRSAAARTGSLGPVYPGTCRDQGGLADTADNTIRLRSSDEEICFRDAVHGPVACAIGECIGDIVIRRRGGLIAYSLAVVVDDHDQGITEIVRGDDLLDFTPAQIYLQRTLGFDTPAYMHVPVAVNPAGDKLSKQTGAEPVDDSRPGENLHRCLEFLKQSPPPTLRSASTSEIWDWAGANWRPEMLGKHAGTSRK